MIVIRDEEVLIRSSVLNKCGVEPVAAGIASDQLRMTGPDTSADAICPWIASVPNLNLKLELHDAWFWERHTATAAHSQ